MRMKDNRRLGLWLCFLFIALSASAQYAVRGGNGTPMLAKTDRDLQVWLINGMNNVEISYTSSTSANHQWFRYQKSALEAQPVSSTQNGTTSTISNIEDGWGYFVQETSVTNRYVWLIDYSKYTFTIDHLHADGGTNACSFLYLRSDATIPKIPYSMPSSGAANELERTFNVSYDNLQYSADAKQFIQVKTEETLEGTPFDKTLKEVPLMDTVFELKGDQFARHFNQEKTVFSELYQAVAVEAHADTTIVVDPFSGGGSGLSAPATITFRAYANDPVAALYIWNIYRRNSENGSEGSIIRYTGDEITHTFAEAGGYRAELEVTDRTTTCTVTSEPIDIDISESYLEIPNAFSPGTTPGINDEFRVGYKSLVSFKGWIFNRWGNQLFHWTDPSKGWDGKKGGKYVPPGVYFYVIEAVGSEGKKYKESGDINILRSKTIDDAPIN